MWHGDMVTGHSFRESAALENDVIEYAKQKVHNHQTWAQVGFIHTIIIKGNLLNATDLFCQNYIQLHLFFQAEQINPFQVDRVTQF